MSVLESDDTFGTNAFEFAQQFLHGLPERLVALLYVQRLAQVGRRRAAVDGTGTSPCAHENGQR